jgi:hypothetical protein
MLTIEKDIVIANPTSVPTTKLTRSRRSGTRTARMMFEFHIPVNCPERRLLRAAPCSAISHVFALPRTTRSRKLLTKPQL